MPSAPALAVEMPLANSNGGKPQFYQILIRFWSTKCQYLPCQAGTPEKIRREPF